MPPLYNNKAKLLKLTIKRDVPAVMCTIPYMLLKPHQTIYLAITLYSVVTTPEQTCQVMLWAKFSIRNGQAWESRPKHFNFETQLCDYRQGMTLGRGTANVFSVLCLCCQITSMRNAKRVTNVTIIENWKWFHKIFDLVTQIWRKQLETRIDDALTRHCKKSNKVIVTFLVSMVIYLILYWFQLEFIIFIVLLTLPHFSN